MPDGATRKIKEATRESVRRFLQRYSHHAEFTKSLRDLEVLSSNENIAMAFTSS